MQITKNGKHSVVEYVLSSYTCKTKTRAQNIPHEEDITSFVTFSRLWQKPSADN